MAALVDTHTHVQMPQFKGDQESVIRRALANGVTRLVVPGVDVPTSRDAVTLARAWPGHIFAAAGTHPHDADTLTDTAFAELRALVAAPEVVAIGETGLDFYRNLAPREAQLAAITRQIHLAREVDLPIILHNRDSHAEMIATLKEHAQGVRGVFHCFIGDRQMARDALELGFYLSFAGPVTYPKNTELMDVAAWAPLDRILVETDAPYLTPVPYRGKRNEPGHVALTARHIAELRDIPFEELVEATSRNATALFRLPEPPAATAEPDVSLS
jgi:TatD DNase family protein